MDKLLNKTIQITSKEIKATQYGQVAKIKDENGKTYSIFQTKKDGSTTVAWEQLEKLPIGTNVMIGYDEEIKNHPQHGNYTSRTIRNFNVDLAGAGSTSSTGATGTNDKFGLRLAIHGMVNGMLASGKSPKEVSISLPELFGLEEDIELRLSKPTSMNVAESKINELPTISYDEPDIDVSDIDF